MMDCTEDLILEIISFLPKKFAVQCKCLNKSFNKLISDPKFAIRHALRSDRKIILCYSSTSYAGPLGKFSLNPPQTNEYLSVTDVVGGKIPVVCAILCSSSGRLVLQFSDRNFYYVFNPVTGAYTTIPRPKPVATRAIAINLVDHRVTGRPAEAIGLVDDQVMSLSPPCKMVAAIEHERSDGQQVFRFEIFEPENNRWRESKNSLKITCDNSSFARASEPAYVHGCLHWLRENGDVLVFDVDKELPGLIGRPDATIFHSISPSTTSNRRKIWYGIYTWFGVVEGSLAHAIAIRDEIVICIRDNEKGEWRTRNICTNIPVTYWFDGNGGIRDELGKGRPVFYDGKTLVFMAGKRNKEIYTYQIQGSSTWNKIGSFPDWTDSILSFHYFLPTIANIPNCSYIHEKLPVTEEAALCHLQVLQPRLSKLQKLLLL